MPSGREQERVSRSTRRTLPALVCAFAATAALVGLYVAIWSFLQDVMWFSFVGPRLTDWYGILVVVPALAVYCTLQKPRRPFFLAGLLGAVGGAVGGVIAGVSWSVVALAGEEDFNFSLMDVESALAFVGLVVLAVGCAVGGAIIVGPYAGVALRACLRPPRTQQTGARWGALWGLLVAGGALVMLLVPDPWPGPEFSPLAGPGFRSLLAVGVLPITIAAGAMLGGALGVLRNWQPLQPERLWAGLAWVAIAAAVPLGGLKWAEMEFHIKSIHQYGRAGDVDVLLDKLATAQYPGVRTSAAFYLQRVYDGKDERVVPALIRALRDQGHVPVIPGPPEEQGWLVSPAVAAARALGEIGDERAVTALGEALSAGHEQVRREVVVALGKMVNKRVIPLLMRAATEDESEAVRSQAATELAALPNRLVEAVKANDVAQVRRLLAAGTDPNAWSEGNYMPLYHAVMQGQTESAKLLLEHGADPNLKAGPSQDPVLFTAINAGHGELAKLLVEHGANVNIKTGGGETLLYLAAKSGKAAVAEALLELGADPNAETGYHDNPLWCAAQRGDIEVMKVLLKHGADIRAQGVHWGMSVLEWAVGQGETDMVALLVEHRADVDARGLSGLPPLCQAARRGDTDMARALLDHNADPNATDIGGQTALHFAAKDGNTELVKLLLERGADPNATDNAPMRPLRWAVERGHDEVARLLREHGGKE